MEKERHYVSRDDIEIVEIVCGKCGESLDWDGESFWHRDPDLNPIEEEPK